MGLLFEFNNQQFELFSCGQFGVSVFNLTTEKRQYFNSLSEVPENWPDHAREYLKNANFKPYETCHICLAPETPMCSCLITMEGREDYDIWKTPLFINDISPPPYIDELEHLLKLATEKLQMSSLLSKMEDRQKVVKNAIVLIGKYIQRQRLITKEASQYYQNAATVLKNYANHCRDELIEQRERNKRAFSESRIQLIEALSGKSKCVS